MIASGIVEFDSETKEGSLEWIQVDPAFQRRGYGKMIVNELFYRLAKMTTFVMVSGRIDNTSQPMNLYKSCYFKGNDIWYICYLNKYQ